MKILVGGTRFPYNRGGEHVRAIKVAAAHDISSRPAPHGGETYGRA
jgi:hypothetical protein